MKFGLSTETIQKLQQLFAEYEDIEKVTIYGSRALGNYREGSDIDLTIIGKNFNSSQLLQINNDIDDLLLPYKVDITDNKQITNDDLKDHIFRVGKLFYKKKKN